MKKQLLLGLALAGSLAAQAQFFDNTPHRGAFGTTNWATGWTNFDPQNTVYPGDGGNNQGRQVVQFNNQSTNAMVITQDITWRSNQVIFLSRPVIIAPGYKLTIEPGCVIRDDGTGLSGSESYILISKGAKIYAVGTPAQPIVFTSGKAPGQRTPGDWGGVLVVGNARTNLSRQPNTVSGSGVLPDGQGQYEALPTVAQATYGGNDDNDNSGVMRYCRIEFAGYNYLPNQELNGLTLAGVGNKTQIDNIQVSYPNDDGFEWFGGNVDHKYLISLGATDDDFDMDEGFRGRVQHLLAVKDPRFWDTQVTSGVPSGTSNSLEWDNNTNRSNTSNGKVSWKTAPEPLTRVVAANLTIVGPQKSGLGNSSLPTGQRFGTAALIRTGNASSIHNSIFVGFNAAFAMQNGNTAFDSSSQKWFADGISDFRGNRFTTNVGAGTPVNSTNPPASGTGSAITAAELRTRLTNATRNNEQSNTNSDNVGFIAGEYPEASNSTSITFTGVNYALQGSSPYLNGSIWSASDVASDLLTDLVVTTNQPVSGAYRNVTIANGGIANLTSDLRVFGTLTVQTGGRLNGNEFQVYGIGEVVVAADAILSTTREQGINVSGYTGLFATTSTRSVSPDVDVVYAGTSAQVTGEGLTQVNDLTITDNHTLSISSRYFDISGIARLQAGTFVSNGSNTLRILSTATQTGAIDNFSSGYTGTISGSFIFQRYAGSGYRHVVSPVAGATLGQHAANCIFIRNFSEETNNWPGVPVNCGNLATGTGSNPVRSQLVYGFDPTTSNFFGTLRNSNVAVDLERTNPATPGIPAGWNAVGNPYTSPISWTAVVAIPGNLATAPSFTNGATLGSAWVLNSTTGQYGTINSAGVTTGGASNIIAPGQGFLVRRATVDPNPGTLVFNNSVRVAAVNNTFIRQAAPNQLVRLVLAGEGTEDEIVAYAEGAAKDGEDAYDTQKLRAEDKALASFYSVDAEGQHLSINALPAATGDRVIALGVNAPKAGRYTISLKELTNMPVGTVALLEDAKYGRFINLSEAGTYTVDLTGASDSRFKLHLVSGATTQAGKAQALATAFAADGQIKVVFTDATLQNAAIRVVNSLGQVVATANKAEGAVTALNLNAPAGVYMVSVVAAGSEYNTRVFFNQR